MKLYTEEQVQEAYDAGMQFIGEDKGSPIEFFSSLTPIELPSDKEIDNACIVETNNLPSEMVGFIIGAKWMRNKIQGGNK